MSPRKILTSAVLMSAVLSLTACALPERSQRPNVYDFGLLPPPSALASAERRPSLVIEAVDAPPALGGRAISYRLLYSGSDQQPRPYSQATWSMGPAELFGQRLQDRLGQNRIVLQPGSGQARQKLQVELQEFVQIFDSEQDSRGVVRLRATVWLLSAQGHETPHQKSFQTSQPAPTPDSAGAAEALRLASDQIITELMQWLDELSMQGVANK